MSTALISDIHGNLVAFDAVLADIAAQGVERIVFLGDVALTGPQPREAVARLRSLACSVIMGNCDAWMLAPESREPRDENARNIQEIDQWTVDQLAPADLDYLRTFQPTVSVALDDAGTGGESGMLLCYHGSPRSFHEQIDPETPHELLDEFFQGGAARVYAGGHTHEQMVRRHRQALVVNPGSVGLPFDRVPPSPDARNPSWAEYAILSVAGERLSVELRRVPFDLAALVRAAHESGMPHAEW
jgi:predicted phosphodiesterase